MEEIFHMLVFYGIKIGYGPAARLDSPSRRPRLYNVLLFGVVFFAALLLLIPLISYVNVGIFWAFHIV